MIRESEIPARGTANGKCTTMVDLKSVAARHAYCKTCEILYTALPVQQLGVSDHVAAMLAALVLAGGLQ